MANLRRRKARKQLPIDEGWQDDSQYIWFGEEKRNREW
jgi:hypothetical protein